MGTDPSILLQTTIWVFPKACGYIQGQSMWLSTALFLSTSRAPQGGQQKEVGDGLKLPHRISVYTTRRGKLC